jgi:hypothetical protein
MSWNRVKIYPAAATQNLSATQRARLLEIVNLDQSDTDSAIFARQDRREQFYAAASCFAAVAGVRASSITRKNSAMSIGFVR